MVIIAGILAGLAITLGPLLLFGALLSGFDSPGEWGPDDTLAIKCVVLVAAANLLIFVGALVVHSGHSWARFVVSTGAVITVGPVVASAIIAPRGVFWAVAFCLPAIITLVLAWT